MRLGWITLGKYFDASSSPSPTVYTRSEILKLATEQGHEVRWMGAHKRVRPLDGAHNDGPAMRQQIEIARNKMGKPKNWLSKISLADVDASLFPEVDSLMIEGDCNLFKTAQTVALVKLLVEKSNLPEERIVYWLIDPDSRMLYYKKFQQAGLDIDKINFATPYYAREFKRQFVMHMPYDLSLEVPIVMGNKKAVYTGHDYERREVMKRMFDFPELDVYGRFTREGSEFIRDLRCAVHGPVPSPSVIDLVSQYTGSMLITMEKYGPLGAWSDRINQEAAAGTPVIYDSRVIRRGREEVLNAMLPVSYCDEARLQLRELQECNVCEYMELVENLRAAVKKTSSSHQQVLDQLVIEPGTGCLKPATEGSTWIS